MKVIDIQITDIDKLGFLEDQIKQLKEQADAIKDTIKEAASLTGEKHYEGSLYCATYVEANVKNVDYKKLLTDLGITADTISQYTTTSARYTLKVNHR